MWDATRAITIAPHPPRCGRGWSRWATHRAGWYTFALIDNQGTPTPTGSSPSCSTWSLARSSRRRPQLRLLDRRPRAGPQRRWSTPQPGTCSAIVPWPRRPAAEGLVPGELGLRPGSARPGHHPPAGAVADELRARRAACCCCGCCWARSICSCSESCSNHPPPGTATRGPTAPATVAGSRGSTMTGSWSTPAAECRPWSRCGRGSACLRCSSPPTPCTWVEATVTTTGMAVSLWEWRLPVRRRLTLIERLVTAGHLPRAHASPPHVLTSAAVTTTREQNRVQAVCKRDGGGPDQDPKSKVLPARGRRPAAASP